MDNKARRQLRLIAHYLAATKNEIAVDQSVYSLCACDPSQLAYAPRPAKLWSVIGSGLVPARVVIKFVSLLWRMGLDKCWFLFDFLRLLIGKEKFDAGFLALPSEMPVALSFSPRALGVLESVNALSHSSCLVRGPGSERLVVSPEVTVLNYSSLLTWRDCTEALRLSFIISGRMRHKSAFKIWRLQSYTAFKWIAFYLAIEKMPSHKFVITDHYDRWAVLVDRLVAEKKKAQSSLTIVQHGSLVGLSSTSMEATFSVKIPTRLGSVSKLYVYNEGAAEVFRKHILSCGSLRRGLEVECFKPGISLSPVSSDFSVLIVGHAICENFHLFLYDQMVSNSTIDFFYKPHPTVSPSREVRARGWYLIEQADFFPKVDLLISYPSTLVAEYEGSGIGAILHPLAIKPEEYEAVLSKIINKLQSAK
ncbi:hypothetical protein [Pseudomonas sp. St316]|uniref:hypothetical protein n=1 Tax=Pseudomonas sp. St316 TaxID=2678257 RepID=UPI001BB3131C|nr:hypothetical protein [Pseudomonas sp. St316]BBP60728.1 hypothetical protein PHLH4_43180 [Pseudomonas sp. St316]